MFSLTAGMATLLAFAVPQKAAAQYGVYPPVSQSSPYQPPYNPYQPGPSAQNLGGTWFMSGHEDQPCQILPSRIGDRALFINENGGRAEGFIRGNRITVPRWNLGARIDGDVIRWSNRSVWTR